MNSADKIKRLFEKAELGINPDADEKVFQDIFQAQQKIIKTTPAPPVNIWRMIMKNPVTKIAIASVVIFAIAGTLYFGFTGGSVTAAEMLEKVIQSNANYKGWLHITHTLTEEVSEGTFRGEGIVHMNTIDGTMIVEELINGERKIKYYSPPTKEYIEYSSLENQVTIYDLESFPAEQLVAMYPLTLDATLTLFKQTTGKEPYDISFSQDKDFERFDITLFENEEEASRVSNKVNSELPVSATVWVEDQTQLIRKLKSGKISQTIEYGEPLIENIYDLGVPTDSLVTDNRKHTDVQIVLERLSQRIKGFGDYFAVMTETPINDDGTPDHDFCALSITAQKGETWLYSRYLVGTDKYSEQNPRNSVMETPVTWPTLDYISTLEKLKYASPSEYFIYDGQNLYLNTTSASRNLDVNSIADSIKKNYDLPNKIWFGKNYGPGTKMELINSTDGTNQIGLHIEFKSSISPSMQERHEEYYWFDSKRQDMPVRSLSRDYSSDGQKIKSEFNTTYLDYFQLPDGTWYPTHWQTFSVVENSNQETREFRMIILTNYEVEEDWFKPPENKIMN